jgi:hypothetical protein
MALSGCSTCKVQGPLGQTAINGSMDATLSNKKQWQIITP